MKVVTKPWGKEEWIEINEKYCYKRIYITEGYKTSFQYHNIKLETNYIISGSAEIWLENDEGVVEKKIMSEGDYFTVLPLRKHRVIAITNLIMQEVSTPEVDDVIRIEDDNKRENGKIDGEHLNPAVLILAAGTGSRLGEYTKAINKVLLPINNKAVISHIIEKFPSTYDFIITKGYKGDVIEEYCRIAHPNHNFTFVTIDKYEGEGTGPGYSALKCEGYLQRPFYFIAGDCIIDGEIPPIDYNWVGASATLSPEIYSTMLIDSSNNVKLFSNKSNNGFDNAFIGLAAIWDYKIFWKELNSRIKNGEIISAFENPLSYPILKARYFRWFDTGSPDGLCETKKYFNDIPLSLSKKNSDIIYKEKNKILKFFESQSTLINLEKRSECLKDLLPNNLKFTENFMTYDWVEGKTLYDIGSVEIYMKFLEFFNQRIFSVVSPNDESIHEFYIDKTNNRKQMFLERFSNRYYDTEFMINGVKYNSMKNLYEKLNIKLLENTFFYTEFHGDLQFANIIYSEKEDKFVYIDWRENFGKSIDSGDLHYDLGKLYGGILISYNLMTNENNIRIIENDDVIVYEYNTPDDLIKFKPEFENWAKKLGFSLNHIKLVTALIYLNMSPLHDDNFSKLLWYKSIEMLSENL